MCIRDRLIDVQGHSTDVAIQSPYQWLLPKYSIAKSKTTPPQFEPLIEGPLRISFSNLPCWLLSPLAALRWKLRDPVCSYFVTTHSPYRQTDRRQTTSYDKGGTLQCNCNVPLKLNRNSNMSAFASFFAPIEQPDWQLAVYKFGRRNCSIALLNFSSFEKRCCRFDILLVMFLANNNLFILSFTALFAYSWVPWLWWIKIIKWIMHNFEQEESEFLVQV